MAREIANFVKDLRVARHEETAEEREVRLTEEHEATQREAVYREKEKERSSTQSRAWGCRGAGGFEGRRKRKEEALTARICDTQRRPWLEKSEGRSALRAEAFRKMPWKPSPKGKTRSHGEVAEEKDVKNDTSQRSGRRRKNHGEGLEGKGKTLPPTRKTSDVGTLHCGGEGRATGEAGQGGCREIQE